jgi:hypothetical protein
MLQVLLLDTLVVVVPNANASVRVVAARLGVLLGQYLAREAISAAESVVDRVHLGWARREGAHICRPVEATSLIHVPLSGEDSWLGTATLTRDRVVS